MNKIEKFLQKLSKKERQKLLDLIVKIIALDLKDLDVKKMKKFDDLFRIREGKIRIVFKKEKGRGILVNIDYRGRVYKR